MDPDIFSERQKSIFGSNVNGVAHLAPETVLIPIKCGTLKGDSHGISDIKIPSVNKSCKDAELCIATFTKGYFEELGNPQTSSQYVYLGCRGFRYLETRTSLGDSWGRLSHMGQCFELILWEGSMFQHFVSFSDVRPTERNFRLSGANVFQLWF